jgi:hypothetical protein
MHHPAAANRYLHGVEGRDAAIASALSELAASGDAAKLPRSIVAPALMSHVDRTTSGERCLDLRER